MFTSFFAYQSYQFNLKQSNVKGSNKFKKLKNQKNV
jgi:hypothetical protein